MSEEMRKVGSEYYEAITDKVVALMEAHGQDWTKPWTTGANASLPRNIITGNIYRGINTIPLALMTMANGWEHPFFASRKQWESIRAELKPDATPCDVIFYKPGGNNQAVLRLWTVYNASDVKPETFLLRMPRQPEPNSDERLAETDAWIKKTEAKIKHGFGHACYIPSRDEIHMPNFETFVDAPSYYGTALHELTHWTGNKDRLNRLRHSRFGDEEYANEELVAELGAAFLCVQHGITPEPRADHAKYLNHWVSHLKNHPRAIFQASAKAQKAVSYMNDLVYNTKTKDEIIDLTEDAA